MSAITTHILDLARGRPAEGVAVTLEAREGGGWRAVGAGVTDDDGRLKTLLPAGQKLEAGDYRLTFATGPYFAARETPSFYPEVTVVFTVEAAREHYHVPLLLSPYGYSTYRGS
jgi:5-hydroxyisourate hydrolase